MVEIFAELPQEIKDSITKIIDILVDNYNPKDCVSIINEIINTTENEEEKDFIRFYFNLKVEQLNNEGNNDKR